MIQTQKQKTLKHAKQLLSNKLQNADQYPYNLICLVRIRIYHKTQQNIMSQKTKILKLKGTGCLIQQNILLTAAHNLYPRQFQISKYSNLNKQVWDNSYIAHIDKLNGESGEYHIKKVEQIKKYPDNKDYDFCIVHLQPKNQKLINTKLQYMPIVVISPQNAANLKSIQISGYSKDITRQNICSKMINNKIQGSSCLSFQSDSQGKIKEFRDIKITYDIPTMEGISGSPIFTDYQNQKIIIGIHTGKQNGQNTGIAACNMIQQLNELGFRLFKKPLVYTQKTLRLRKKDWISKLSDLLIMDRNYSSTDILVYTAFDLTNLKRIFLSGNSIGNTGVEYFLRKSYPKLQSLYLTSNKIDDLSKIPQKNWLNIPNIKTLSFNHNQLTQLPDKISQLTKIQRFWIIQNYLKHIPQCLMKLTRLRKSSLTVYIYKNKIGDQEQNNANMEVIKQCKTMFVWQRQNNVK